MSWYIARGGEPRGPFAEDTFRAWAAAGDIRPEDLVLRSGDPAWREARAVPGLLPPRGPSAPSGPLVASPKGLAEGAATTETPPLRPTSREAGDTLREANRNYFRVHWAGDLTLAVSYWVNGLAALLLLSGLFALLGTIDWTESPRLAASSWSAASVLALVVGVWHLIGVWRSADKRVSRSGRAGWAAAAKLLVILGALRTVLDVGNAAGPQLAALYDLATGDRETIGHTLRVMRDGSELEISGEVGFGLTTEVEKILDAHPTVRLVHLGSKGGEPRKART